MSHSIDLSGPYTRTGAGSSISNAGVTCGGWPRTAARVGSVRWYGSID
ncbi:hypothetical protein GMA12_12015 [Kocuria sediminis]|uniref:Uncharacterized protein n=1 Tax=Kocuria sediminis TaxID=1038857 RepID=A0A6N8GRE6_9MICC|nr:hypothetical protein [Kocuria sediminis]MUN63853.1 hypothetical protein [Kocuria sediminis]